VESYSETPSLSISTKNSSLIEKNKNNEESEPLDYFENNDGKENIQNTNCNYTYNNK
jgi:hypothetical protein